MKKIIALAVASAFVAPVMAADIQITGEIEYQYNITDDNGTDSTAIQTDEASFNVSASEELPNGWMITGQNDIDDGASDGGEIALSGPFGKFEIGDAGGPLDNVDEVAGGAPEEGGDVAVGADLGMVYQLPTIAPGLTVVVGMSPDTASEASDDASGYAVSYETNGLYVFYGQQEIGTQEDTGMGIKYSASGLTVAYEVSDEGDTIENTGMFASYKFGDVEVGYELQEAETSGAVAFDQNIAYVQYHLGPVDLYIETSNEDVGNVDETNIGIEYGF